MGDDPPKRGRQGLGFERRIGFPDGLRRILNSLRVESCFHDQEQVVEQTDEFRLGGFGRLGARPGLLFSQLVFELIKDLLHDRGNKGQACF